MGAESVAGDNGSFKLEPRDIEFFRQGRQAVQSLNDRMNGVLEYIIRREGLQAKSVKLSDDGTELILER
jgi:hypothetical protein